jgi:hypothetical protein
MLGNELQARLKRGMQRGSNENVLKIMGFGSHIAKCNRLFESLHRTLDARSIFVTFFPTTSSIDERSW